MSTSLRHFFSINIDLYNLKVKMFTLPQVPPWYKKNARPYLKVLASRKLVLASEIKVVTSHWAC